MPNWKSKIELKDLHKAYDHGAGDITIQQVAAGLAQRIRLNRYAEELEDIAMELEDLAAEPEETDTEELVQWYDYLLSQLYDFGDFEHRIWINTI